MKKTVGHESDNQENCDWCFWHSLGRIIKENGALGNKRTSGVDPNYNIIMIGHNTEKSPGDLGRLAVTLTSVKDHQQVSSCLQGSFHYSGRFQQCCSVDSFYKSSNVPILLLTVPSAPVKIDITATFTLHNFFLVLLQGVLLVFHSYSNFCSFHRCYSDNNDCTIVWMKTILFLVSTLKNLYSRFLGIVHMAPVMIGSTVNFKFRLYVIFTFEPVDCIIFFCDWLFPHSHHKASILHGSHASYPCFLWHNYFVRLLDSVCLSMFPFISSELVN